MESNTKQFLKKSKDRNLKKDLYEKITFLKEEIERLEAMHNHLQSIIHSKNEEIEHLEQIITRKDSFILKMSKE